MMAYVRRSTYISPNDVMVCAKRKAFGAVAENQARELGTGSVVARTALTYLNADIYFSYRSRHLNPTIECTRLTLQTVNKPSIFITRALYMLYV